jgi:23S rRNA (uracil1939-C5)-methyltransferase
VLTPGQRVPLIVEKPVSGGRMLARLDGRIVLVGGAIPGERLVARIDTIAKGVVYATAEEIEQPSADRRDVAGDPLCGGCLYAHIAYPRQRALKAQVIDDAFARIARLTLPAPLEVRGEREDGYRMRARLHARNGRVGFFREATHDVCDPRATGQLLPGAVDAVERIVDQARSLGVEVREAELSENADASGRVIHIETAAMADANRLGSFQPIEGVTGITTAAGTVLNGSPYVTDALSFGADHVNLRRHVLSFFQGNRYLLAPLVSHVVDAVDRDSAVVDLYAGTGLFAVSAAISRGARVIAVEGDRTASKDLEQNAIQAGGSVETVHGSVETFTAKPGGRPDTVIVDPPRTGISRDAMKTLVRLGGKRIVYVSCDVATLARDARKLVDSGYAVMKVDGFDLFPNTPHVETVVSFEKS